MNPAALASVEQFEEDRARWRKYVAEVEVLHCNKELVRRWYLVKARRHVGSLTLQLEADRLSIDNVETRLHEVDLLHKKALRRMQTWRERAGNGTLEHAINKTVRKLSRSDSTRVQLKHTLKSVISSGSRAEAPKTLVEELEDKLRVQSRTLGNDVALGIELHDLERGFRILEAYLTPSLDDTARAPAPGYDAQASAPPRQHSFDVALPYSWGTSSSRGSSVRLPPPAVSAFDPVARASNVAPAGLPPAPDIPVSVDLVSVAEADGTKM
ncbi:hypothetical protein JCM8208_002593 [Rhodotorula glutinis]